MKTADFYQGTADAMGVAISLPGRHGHQLAQRGCPTCRDYPASRALEAGRGSRSR
jgi:hypothetical protein